MIIGVELRHDLTLPSVRIFSDATDSARAMQEIASWVLINHFVPFAAFPLAVAERGGRNRYFCVACSDRAIAAAGHRIYVEEIGAAIEAETATGSVAIDILSSGYSVADCEEAAAAALRASHPQAMIYVMEVGFRHPIRRGDSPRRPLAARVPQPVESESADYLPAA